MHGRDVILLDEGIERGLPIAVSANGLVPRKSHSLEFVGLQVFRNRGEIIEQRLGIRIHVDKYPATPRVHVDLLKRHIFLAQTSPVVFVHDSCTLAIQVVAPAVILAKELSGVADPLDQLASTMLADIEIGLDRFRPGPDNDDRIMNDRIFDEVADLGNLLQAAGDLPDLGPQSFGFEPSKFRRQIGIL